MSSPHFGPRTATGNQWLSRTEPESSTSAFSTTSYDTYNEESQRRDTSYSDRETRERTQSSADREARDTTYSSHDVTRTSSDSAGNVTVVSTKKDVTFYSREGETSTDTERHGSYDFRYPAHEETIEWSCDEAGSCQKLSFMFLVISFLAITAVLASLLCSIAKREQSHGLAVCTPYWVVGWQGGQMTLYEGVWLSCYRERGQGSWVCSTFDVIRHLFEQPVWYEACQVSAVLSVVLLIPALLVGSLYSYVISLRGRSRASWLLIIFLASATFCSFLSIVIFAGGYPYSQTFPPGEIRFHASFALQMVSFFISLLSLFTHVRDSYPHLRVWENKLCSSDRIPPVPSCGPITTCTRGVHMNVLPPRPPKPAKSPPASGLPKLKQFSFPKFPSALSRFQSKGENPSAPPLESIEETSDGRETTAARVEAVAVPSPARARAAANGGESLAAYNDSMSGYDSQV